MTSVLPLSVRLAWWGTAWLRGHVVSDQMVDGVVGDDAVHLVGGADGGRAAGRSVSDGSGAPARPGSGWPCPSPVTRWGWAVRARSTPPRSRPARPWCRPARTWAWCRPASAGVGDVVAAAARRQVPDVGEADRALGAALLETADELARLDVARWRPEVADELIDLRHPHPVEAPPGIPSRCLELAGRGFQAVAIVELALVDDGGAISAAETGASVRAGSLERAARRALVAACSPDVWPG